ncbi:MAG: hypothetical protein PHT69_02255 [Bacteroidales bacterium]|nr:hypothetical protein [Bacteroidales bacterium]
MKLKHEIDYKGLEEFLKQLTYQEIETTWNKPEHPKLIEGHTRDEIEYFDMDASKIKEESIVEHGEPFLVDALGNDLSIVILSKRLYKLPDNSRSIKAKFVTTIIDDCSAIYGTPLNGYWKIPSQFIKKIKK